LGLKSFYRVLEASRSLLRRHPGRDVPRLQEPFGRVPKPFWRAYMPLGMD